MARGSFGTYSSARPRTRWTGGGRVAGGGGLGMEISVVGHEGQSDLGLAFEGRLLEVLEDERHRLLMAYHDAMTRVVDADKAALRADIVAGGFHKAQALSKTWRATVYPKLPKSLEVTGWFATKARLLIEAFDTGVTIRAKDGNYLAIPQGPAKAIVRRMNRFIQTSGRDSGVGRDYMGKFVAQDNPVARVASSLGVKLRAIIDHQTGRGVLVADNGLRLTKSGKAAKSQRGQATVLFALTRVATLKKRIRGRELLDQLQASFPTDFAMALAAELGPEDSAA